MALVVETGGGRKCLTESKCTGVNVLHQFVIRPQTTQHKSYYITLLTVRSLVGNYVVRRAFVCTL